MSEQPRDEIGHEGEIVLEAPANVDAPAAIGVLTARFVRYPGSQQLILWLPQSGYFGYGALRMYGPDGALLEDGPVSARLNGSVQILSDTYPWPPGDYRIEITHEDGWRHELRLRKLEAGVAAPAPPAPPPEPPRDEPIVYRDGFGNVLPNVDLEMRAAAQEKLADMFGRKLKFEGNARAGEVIYIEGKTRIRFSHEMCGGGVNISIDVPRAERWENATTTPLARRDEILEFVARETQRIQAPSWRYVIREDRIDLID
jgi:hypothetical protein